MNCIFKHREYSRAFRRGHRDKSGKWISTGEDYQVCMSCGHERPAPIQFPGSTLEDSTPRRELMEVSA